MNYVLVNWPKCQTYMEEDWFLSEAILGEESSYLIPEEKLIDNDYIIDRIVELVQQYDFSEQELANANERLERILTILEE